MTTWQVLVVVFAAVGLGLGAFALYVALSTRTVALDAVSRISRHTQEHRSGIEDEGLRRHRADEPPLTGQLPRVAPHRPVVDPDDEPGLPTAETPAPRRFDLPPPGSIAHPRP